MNSQISATVFLSDIRQDGPGHANVLGKTDVGKSVFLMKLIAMNNRSQSDSYPSANNETTDE